MPEMMDLYDENRNPLHRKALRYTKPLPGEYRLVAAVWVANSQGRVLVTLRHPDKISYPNTWENTGGAVLAGETSLEGAVRELREETGIIAQPEELVLLDSVLKDNVFFDTYFLHRDLDIGSIVLQEGETAAAKWVSLEALNAMADDESLARPIGQRLRMLYGRLLEEMAKVAPGFRPQTQE